MGLRSFSIVRHQKVQRGLGKGAGSAPGSGRTSGGGPFELRLGG